jgi:hypothetical protein
LDCKQFYQEQSQQKDYRTPLETRNDKKNNSVVIISQRIANPAAETILQEEHKNSTKLPLRFTVRPVTREGLGRHRLAQAQWFRYIGCPDIIDIIGNGWLKFGTRKLGVVAPVGVVAMPPI